MAAPRFADAVAKYDEARIVLFGVPYDRTCSFRGGCRFAPPESREAPYNFGSYLMEHPGGPRDIPPGGLGGTPRLGGSAGMGDRAPENAGRAVGAADSAAL